MSKIEEKELKEVFLAIGELVLFASTLDDLLSKAVISVLGLGKNPMLLPVVATLDPSRKIEILKEWSHHIKKAEWKNGLKVFTEKSEYIFKYRNIACHSLPVRVRGEWRLIGASAAKKLKGLKSDKSALASVSILDLRKAIESGVAAHAAGENVISNYQRVDEERVKKFGK